MARKEQRQRIARHDATDRARRFGAADLRRDPCVGARLTGRYARCGSQRSLLERREVADVDDLVVDRPRAEEAFELALKPWRRFPLHDVASQPPLGTSDDVLRGFAGVEAE